jgi:glycogen synthase
MRVLHITTEFPPIIYGGLGTAVGGLVSASVSHGLEVAVLLVGHGAIPGYLNSVSEFADAPAQRDDNCLVWSVPHATSVTAGVEFARRWRPDVIHVHVFWLAHVAAAIRKATGAALVYTVHSLDRAEYEIGEGPPECLTQWSVQHDLICGADLVVALCELERQLVAEYCPAASDRIRIVGNGIADTRHARMSARHRRARDTITILFTGRFVERKGIREILEAAPAILAAAPHARLVLAGGHRHACADDLSRHWLPACCARVRDRIEFTGWQTQDQMCDLYSEADILLVPSWYEPFGMVILEGMLYGLAIIASRVGGPIDILHEEKTALFCEPRDVASLAAQQLRLVGDADLRSRLGRSAASQVRESWMYSNIVEQMTEVYAQSVNWKRLARARCGDSSPSSLASEHSSVY